MYIFETSIFGFHIAPTWYWLMYAIWFIICYLFLKKYTIFHWDDLDSYLLYVFFWVILWGRLWYVILYNPSYYIANIDEIIAIWKWGMSFHGWCIWVILATFIFSIKKKYNFWNIIDTLAVIIPIALWLWRIWNYINGELPWFTPYEWYFPIIKEGVHYFPSPLLEMFLEWVLLFVILFFFWKVLQKYSKNTNTRWILSAIFLIWYSIARLISEQFRLPDEHVWYLFSSSWITLWMLYTIPMLSVGILILWIRYRDFKNHKHK